MICIHPDAVESREKLARPDLEQMANLIIMAQSTQCENLALSLCRGVVGFALNPTNKGPKGIADMGCKSCSPPSIRPTLYYGRMPMYVMGACCMCG